MGSFRYTGHWKSRLASIILLASVAACESETEIEKTQRLLTGIWKCTGQSRGLSADVIAEFTEDDRDKNFLGGANVTLKIEATGLAGESKIDAEIVASGEWRIQDGKLAEAYNDVSIQSLAVDGGEYSTSGLSTQQKNRLEQAFSNGSVFSEIRSLDSTSLELVDPTGLSSPSVDGDDPVNPEGRQLSCVKQ